MNKINDKSVQIIEENTLTSLYAPIFRYKH